MSLPKELTKLLESGVHFGHQAKRWNPKMKRFIFAKRSGIYIIDLEKTLEKLNEAKKFLQERVADKAVILFVGTKKQARSVIKDVAEAAGMSYVIDRWVGGLLTNFTTIKKRIDKYNQMISQRDEGRFENYLKKEVVMFNRELTKMSKSLSGLRDMKKVPDILIVVDPRKEILAIKEAMKLSIPIVALLDTDGDPDIVDYPIPGNDDAIKSVRAVMGFLLEAIVEGKKSIPQEVVAQEDSDKQTKQDIDLKEGAAEEIEEEEADID